MAMTTSSLSAELTLKSVSIKTLTAPPFKGLPLPGGASSVMTNMAQTKLNRRSKFGSDIGYLPKDMRCDDFHAALVPQTYKCRDVARRRNSLTSTQVDGLGRMVCTLERALEACHSSEDFLMKRIREVKEKAEYSRASAAARISRLRNEINAVDSSARRHHTRKTIVSRNTTGVVGSLKQGLSDPPEDKEELESESMWEVQMQLIAMEKKRKELSEQRFVVQTARGIYKHKYGNSLAFCSVACVRADKTALLMEKAFYLATVCGKRRILGRIAERESKVKDLKGQLYRSATIARKAEKRNETLRDELNRVHANAIRTGHLTPMTMKRLQDLVKALTELNRSKEEKIGELTTSIASSRSRENEMKKMLHTTRRRALTLGDRSKVSCQYYARVPVKPPVDCSHAIMDFS